MENFFSHSPLLRRVCNKVKRSLFRPYVLFNLMETTSVAADQLLLIPSESSMDALYQRYPKRIRKLFHFLDLKRQGLETVRVAVCRGDWGSACEALVDYYQTHPVPEGLKSLGYRYHPFPAVPVDHILMNTFTFQKQTGAVPLCKDRRLDWGWIPNDDREWAWFLNRHYHLLNLLHAYHQTGNQLYVAQINRHMLDWIVSSFSKPHQWWAQWRGREVALRALHWTSLFYGLTSAIELSPVVRILMLSSLLDHACYLRHLHHWGANWLCREMSGLATIALCWPEFKLADTWFKYARDRLLLELTQQVYPDGVHKELTSHYHRVVFHDIQNFVELSELTKKSIPTLFRQRLQEMLSYLVYSITPTGHSVLNNDSDQEDNRDLIQLSALFYEHLDWLYVTSHGKVGQKPEGEFSRVFPWAGQVINRSGWDEQAHWSFFDIGPAGINYHIHYDKLHLSIVSGGRHLLVDSGRYRYRRDRFWHYFRSSASHNVILIDGRGQGVDCREHAYPLTNQCAFTPTVDFAWGCFKGPFPGLKGKVSHSRAVAYLHGKYWVVVDHIESDRPRKVEPLWHFHPDCTVAIEGETVVSTDSNVSNLRIIPASPFPWKVNLVAGQQHPIQGWWSREYNHCVPNPTAVYSALISTSATFAWVLYPAVGEVPEIDVQVLSVTSDSIKIAISEGLQKETQIIVCLGSKDEIVVSNDLVLQGKCAILSDGQSPLVVLGKFLDKKGSVVADCCPSVSTSFTKGGNI